MKTARVSAVAIIFLVSLAGCRHKAKTVPPPQAQAPVAAPPSNMAHVPSLPALPPPPPPDVGVATSHQPPPEVQQSHKTTHHKASAKPAAGTETANTAAPDKSQTPAANDAASNVSPLGQLSSTGENVSAGRGDIEQLITSTDKGLSNINRALSSQEQLTSTQIRAFLTKARQALSDNDLDGAHTLAVKAQVLLEELTKK